MSHKESFLKYELLLLLMSIIWGSTFAVQLTVEAPGGTREL
ncbi:MAG: hypothetical protein QGH42_03205 [Kiritimatiellia bacterium]|jgi:hypothetical protein|nr:hypothetical protein [Kiritimatiellia bacterium]MDP6810939.1 hypothetical protein [Kiritimatiellia bacterium]MDP7023244.1 hypothetical protein [Kiritimatiellia bacterium]